jgi:hypothetical protein
MNSCFPANPKPGLKIPFGQIASGGFTIGAGQTKDLDIDFNTCASIVIEGHGQYRLKPVLHAVRSALPPHPSMARCWTMQREIRLMEK